MTRRNLTIQLEDDLIRQAKASAARRGLSLSAAIGFLIEELAVRDSRHEEAVRRVDALMNHPVARGGIAWSRNDIRSRVVQGVHTHDDR